MRFLDAQIASNGSGLEVSERMEREEWGRTQSLVLIKGSETLFPEVAKDERGHVFGALCILFKFLIITFLPNNVKIFNCKITNST